MTLLRQAVKLMKDPEGFQKPSGSMISIPRQCRVLLSFEPAFAGGSLPRNAALAQAYRVISLVELETLVVGVGSKRKVQHHEHSRDKFFIP